MSKALMPFRENLSTPMQGLLAETLDRLGGMDFVQEWAEDNPNEFMRLLAAAFPAPQQPSGGQTINLNMHPALAPGPLDIVVHD